MFNEPVRGVTLRLPSSTRRAVVMPRSTSRSGPMLRWSLRSSKEDVMVILGLVLSTLGVLGIVALIVRDVPVVRDERHQEELLSDHLEPAMHELGGGDRPSHGD